MVDVTKIQPDILITKRVLINFKLLHFLKNNPKLTSTDSKTEMLFRQQWMAIGINFHWPFLEHCSSSGIHFIVHVLTTSFTISQSSNNSKLYLFGTVGYSY